MTHYVPCVAMLGLGWNHVLWKSARPCRSKRSWSCKWTCKGSLMDSAESALLQSKHGMLCNIVQCRAHTHTHAHACMYYTRGYLFLWRLVCMSRSLLTKAPRATQGPLQRKSKAVPCQEWENLASRYPKVKLLLFFHLGFGETCFQWHLCSIYTTAQVKPHR